MKVTPVANCRACGGELNGPTRFSLGDMAVVDFPDKPDAPQTIAPLNLVECPQCTLVQLTHSVDPEIMFRHFWYRSGITKSMKASLKEVADAAMEYVDLRPSDGVLDIGTNDGSLMEFFPKHCFRAGFEPAGNVSWLAREKGITTITDFFSAEKLPREWVHRSKVITAIAMFYDVEKLGDFVEAVKLALHPDGVFIVQMNYLGAMIRNMAFDNICHEHLTYFSCRAFDRLCREHGLSVQRIQFNGVNGGSARFFVSTASESPSHVMNFVVAESEDWRFFSDELEGYREVLIELFGRSQEAAICGASTRGLTTLHWLGLGKETFSVAGDRDPFKHGRYYGATGIPIVTEEEARKQARIFLVLPWHFEKEIIEREKKFLESGGKLVFPLPTPKIVSSEGEKFL